MVKAENIQKAAHCCETNVCVTLEPAGKKKFLSFRGAGGQILCYVWTEPDKLPPCFQSWVNR